MKWSFERAWELPSICYSWVRVPIAIWRITPKNCPSNIRIRRKHWEHEKKDVWKGAEGISFGAFLYWIACQRASYTRTRQYTFMPFGLYRFNPKELSNMIKSRKFVSHLDREYKPFNFLTVSKWRSQKILYSRLALLLSSILFDKKLNAK